MIYIYKLYLLLFLLFILFAFALYLLLSTAVGVSSRRALKIARLYTKKRSIGSQLEAAFLMPLVRPLSRLMPDNATLSGSLRRLGYSMTAREYTARTALLSAACVTVAIPLFMLSPLVSMVMVAMGALVAWHFTVRPNDLLKDKTAAIIREMPRLVRTFVYGLKADADVLNLLQKYTAQDGALKDDLEILITDMKLGGYADALERFDLRVNTPQMSVFVSALSAHIRGDNQSAAFTHIAMDAAVAARESVRAELLKRPGKIKTASLPMVVMTLAIWLYVIGSNLIGGLGTFSPAG